MIKPCRILVSALALLSCVLVAAQEDVDAAVLAALQDGGLVIVMRHASSPRSPPEEALLHPENVNGERQLDAQGERDASAFGAALIRLRIPVGEVLSSPTFRALQTARLAGFGLAEPVAELDSGSAREAADWLREQAATAAPGTNRLLVTHGPNINAAFPDIASGSGMDAGMGEGDALIFAPRDGTSDFVGRMAIADWPALAQAQQP